MLSVWLLWLQNSKETIKSLKQSLVQAQTDLKSLGEENKQLKALVTTLQENKELRNNNDISQLKKEFDALKKEKASKSHTTDIKRLQQDVEELTKIREELNGIRNQGDLSAFQQEIQNLKKSRDGINKNLLKKEKQITMLKSEVDRMDQKQRETRLRIMGVPEDENEELVKTITKIAQNKLGMKKFNKDNIDLVYRSGKKKQQRHRDIVVQFKSKTTKDQFQQLRKKLTDGIAPAKKVYLNDDLTEFRQKLLYDARQLAKREKLKAAWSQEGNIIVLKDTNTRPVAITTHEDLRRLVDPQIWQDDDEFIDLYSIYSDLS